MSATDDLARVIMGAPDADSTDPTCQLRYGVVTQASPLLVKVGAATVGQPCGRVSNYQAIVGDYVLVLVRGPDRVVIDSVGATAIGFKGQVTSASDVTGIAGTETDIVTGSVTLKAGRSYEMTMRLHAALTVATDVFFLRGYIGGTLAIFQPLVNTANGQVVNLVSIPVGAAVGGATTIRATLQRSSGTGTASCLNASFLGGVLTVKDIGV